MVREQSLGKAAQGLTSYCIASNCLDTIRHRCFEEPQAQPGIYRLKPKIGFFRQRQWQ